MNSPRGFLSTYRQALADPSGRFEEARESGSMKRAQGFLMKALVLGIPAFFLASGWIFSPGWDGVIAAALLGSSVFGFVSTLILVHVMAAVFHGCAKLLRGEGAFKNSYQVLVYGLIPPAFAGFILAAVVSTVTRDRSPAAVQLAIVASSLAWGARNMTVGGRILHRLGRVRAVVPSVLSLAVLVGMIGYPPLKIERAHRRVEAFCAQADIGAEIEGLEARAQDLGLHVYAMPDGWCKDARQSCPAQISASEGWLYSRWSCVIQHEGGKLIRKYTTFSG